MKPKILERFFRQLEVIEKLNAPLASQIVRYSSRLSEKALQGLVVLVSEETAPHPGKMFPDSSLPFLEMLLPPLRSETETLDGNFTSLWLESYTAMRKAKLLNRRAYFHYWRSDFLRNAKHWAREMIGEFLLFAKFVVAAGGAQAPKVETLSAYKKPFLVDSNRGALIKIESQTARTSKALDYLLAEADEILRQAAAWRVKSFEYHFMGPALPEEWVRRFADVFKVHALSLYEYPVGIDAPQLAYGPLKPQDLGENLPCTEEQTQLQRKIFALNVADQVTLLRDLRRTSFLDRTRTPEEVCATWLTGLGQAKQRHWLALSEMNIGTELWLRIGSRLAEISETALSELILVLRENWTQPVKLKTNSLGRLLRMLFPEANASESSSKKEFAEPWLAAHETFRTLSVKGRSKYFSPWLQRIFSRPDVASFQETMEQYLLFARLARQRSTEAGSSLVFSRTLDGNTFSLKDSANKISLQVEVVPSQGAAESFQTMLRNTRELREQARAVGIDRFEYHFVGSGVPEIWLTSLRECFPGAVLKFFWRRSWDAEPIVLDPSLLLQAKALRSLAESPGFLEVLRRSVATKTEQHFDEAELKDTWRFWIEEVAAKRPSALVLLLRLQKITAYYHPSSESLLEFLLPHDKAIPFILSLSPASWRALQRLVAWKDPEAVRVFFKLLHLTESKSLFRRTLQALDALRDLSGCNVDESLQKSLSYALKNWKAGRNWKGNLEGWIFCAYQVLKLSRSPNPWKRATLEANLGPVTWWSETAQETLTQTVEADIHLEYEDYDLIVEYKAVLNHDQRRQAERYAACLRKRAEETGRHQVMRYYLLATIDAPVLESLEKLFEGLALEISFVADRGNEVKLHR